MFGGLRTGYSILLAGVAAMVLLAHSLTGKPLIAFISLPLGQLALFLATPFMLFAANAIYRMARRGTENPTRKLAKLIYRKRLWLARTFLLTMMVLPAGKAFSTLKNHISLLVPFYADPMFARADNLLFFGNDPWRISHWLLGTGGTIFLDRAYILFFVTGAVANVWLFSTRDLRFQLRGLTTLVLTWFGLGFAAATLLSSSGPIFYHVTYGLTYYDPLVERLHAIHQVHKLNAIFIADWLREEMGKGSFGSGISAMPSLHVAATWLNYLLLQNRFGSRHWTSIMALVFTAIIWVGSFHLAWHYAVDGIVGVLLVTFFWKIAGLYVEWIEGVRILPLPKLRRSYG